MLENSSKNLLQTLIDDEKKINKKLYSAGPYWDYKCKKIYNQIKVLIFRFLMIL